MLIKDKDMLKDLERLQEFVDKMKSTSSLNEKKEIIKTIENDSFIKKVLYYTYNPYFKYHVTSKNCKKYNNNYGDSTGQHLCDMNYMNESIFELLDGLRHREFTGHAAIAVVNGFVEVNEEYADLIPSIPIIYPPVGKSGP